MVIKREKYYCINVDGLSGAEIEKHINNIKTNVVSDDDKIIKLTNFFVPVTNHPTKITLIEYTDNSVSIAYIV